MISLKAIGRLVNILREVSPEAAQRAVQELYDLQQAVNRMDHNIAAIAEKLGVPVVASNVVPISAAVALEVIETPPRTPPPPTAVDEAGTTLQIPGQA